MTGLHFPVPHSPAEPGGASDAPDACTGDDQPAGGQLTVNALRYPDRTGILRPATRLQLFTRVSQTKEREREGQREEKIVRKKKSLRHYVLQKRERMFILPDSSFRQVVGRGNKKERARKKIAATETKVFPLTQKKSQQTCTCTCVNVCGTDGRQECVYVCVWSKRKGKRNKS